MIYRIIPDYVLDNLDRLKSERRRKGVSLIDLRIFCGVGSSTIYRYETGESYPTRLNYNRLAEYFGWKKWPEEKERRSPVCRRQSR